MTVHRQPGTLEHLLFSKIIQHKPDRIEEITGISLDVLIKAANPNHPHNLSAVHIPSLDAALMAAGRDPVFIPYLVKTMERACEDFGISPVRNTGGNVLECTHDAIKHAALMLDTWRAAKCPNGDGGENITNRECDQMLASVAEMRETLDQMEKSIEAARPNQIVRMTGGNRSAS
ncbi:hypothetical protein [Thalassospira aquimaris]|uniref:Uncharacterized protein n=1 Tax=Thalassospira aquimaris TaxID=3037796 RepID=A0ABT6GGF7_9PROT|nr:hypothetical protein [Thalassospira sp. FZY0004]MDG4721181.1 hypothetical protein [Thalassospira sp. FZY0004]